MVQQRPDLQPQIERAVRNVVNKVIDDKLSQQTDRVLGGIYATAATLTAFLTLIAAGVWKLNSTVTRHAEALGEIRGFLQAAFPNITPPWKTPQPPAGPPTVD